MKFQLQYHDGGGQDGKAPVFDIVLSDTNIRPPIYKDHRFYFQVNRFPRLELIQSIKAGDPKDGRDVGIQSVYITVHPGHRVDYVPDVYADLYVIFERRTYTKTVKTQVGCVQESTSQIFDGTLGTSRDRKGIIRLVDPHTGMIQQNERWAGKWQRILMNYRDWKCPPDAAKIFAGMNEEQKRKFLMWFRDNFSGEMYSPEEDFNNKHGLTA